MQILLWIILIIYVLSAILVGLKNNVNSIKFLISILLFQNLFLISFARSMSSIQYTLFTAVKEIMLYEMALIGLVKCLKRIPKKVLYCALIFVLMCIKNLIFSDANLWTRIMAVRQVMIPVVCVMVGFGLNTNAKTVKIVGNRIAVASVLLGVLGLVEYILGDAFWVKLGYVEYLTIKEGEISGFYNGVTINFYTWDIGGYVIRRMVSVMADPLAVAHWFFLGFAVCFSGLQPFGKNIAKEKSYSVVKNRLAVLFLFICCILSFSKAVLVLLAVSVFIKIYFDTNNKNRWIVILIGAVMVFFVAILLMRMVTDISNASATAIHFNGLINGLRLSNLLGRGLGTAGFVTSFTDTDVAVMESYFGVTLVQIGWVGMIAYVLMFLFIALDLYKIRIKTNSKYCELVLILLVGLMVEMLFSESSVSVLGTSVYFVFIGLVYKTECRFASVTKSKKIIINRAPQQRMQ